MRDTSWARLPTFGARLRAARLQAGAQRGRAYSQGEFAERASVFLAAPLHQTRLSRFEADAATPSIVEALALALAADVSVTWLAYGFHADLTDAPDLGPPVPVPSGLRDAERAAAERLVGGAELADTPDSDTDPDTAPAPDPGGARGRARPIAGAARGSRGRAR